MFEIILNRPHIENEKSLTEYESTGELIDNIFPLSEDCLFISWNQIYVPLSYKYDLSIIFDDFVHIYKFLGSQETTLQMTFPSNTFDVIWDLQKNGNDVIISSIWSTVLSHNEKWLNENSSLTISINLFKIEMSKLLKFIYDLIFLRKDKISKFLLNEILENKPEL